MAILNWKVQFPDQVADSGAQQTRLCTLACSDALSVVLQPGYLNQLVSPVGTAQSGTNAQGYLSLPQDMWFIYYNGGSGMFNVSVNSSGIIRLLAGDRLFSQVAITAAQFNGMYAAPVLLVPAPGANQMIIVDNISLIMTYGSAAFAAGGVVAAQYDSTIYGAGVIASTTEAAADYFATANTVFKLNAGAVLAPFSTCANKALYLSNLTQAFTTGTGSSFIAKVNYDIISTIA